MSLLRYKGVKSSVCRIFGRPDNLLKGIIDNQKIGKVGEASGAVILAQRRLALSQPRSSRL